MTHKKTCETKVVPAFPVVLKKHEKIYFTQQVGPFSSFDVCPFFCSLFCTLSNPDFAFSPFAKVLHQSSEISVQLQNMIDRFYRNFF